MKLISVTRDANVHALEKMLYLTCGESVDVLLNAEVHQLGHNFFHVRYDSDEAHESFDFDVRISDEANESREYHYTITI